MNALRTLAALLLTAAALLPTGCGNDCGPGTVEVDGECVPAGEACADGTMLDESTMTCVPAGSACANGTVLTDGVCVADGSVVCTGNTMFNMTSGLCEVGEGACTGNTVLVNGECVSADSQLSGMADAREPMEPNDVTSGTAATLNVPAEGASTSVYGCINPEDFDGDGQIDNDIDDFQIEVTGPTLLNMSADGIGGLSAAFAVVAISDPALTAEQWIRWGLDLSNDGVSRQVYLPAAGQYVIRVLDSHAAFGGGPVGGPGTCYFMQMEQVAIPAPTPITGSTTTGTFDEVTFLSASVSNDSTIYQPSLSHESVVLVGAMTFSRNGAYEFGAVDEEGTARGLLLGSRSGDDLLIVVDAVQSLARMPISWELTLGESGGDAPEDGTVDLTYDEGSPLEFLGFDATEGDMVNVEFESQSDGTYTVLLAGPDGAIISEVCSLLFGFLDETCNATTFWFRAPETGRYNLVLQPFEATDGDTDTVRIARTSVTPMELTSGDDQAISLGDADRAFFTYDATDAIWLRHEVSGLMNVEDVDVKVYDIEGFGALDIDHNPTTEASLDATGTLSQILGGSGGNFLISVSNTEDHSGDEAFTYSLTDGGYTDLGEVRSSAAGTADDVELDGSGKAFFFADVLPGSSLTITATPASGADITLGVLDDKGEVAEPINEGGAGAAETSMIVATARFIALEVSGPAGQMVDLEITALDPPYSVGPTAEPFSDACAGGMNAGVDGEDDSLTEALSLGMTFNYFGQPVDEVIVSTNGWMTFDPAYDGSSGISGSFPSADGGVVAPLWRDLTMDMVCIKPESGKTTIQWNGTYFGSEEPVQVQVVLNASGQIDFVYGPMHTAQSATVGIENQDGSVFFEWDMPPMASSSVSFSPN